MTTPATGTVPSCMPLRSGAWEFIFPSVLVELSTFLWRSSGVAQVRVERVDQSFGNSQQWRGAKSGARQPGTTCRSEVTCPVRALKGELRAPPGFGRATGALEWGLPKAQIGMGCESFWCAVLVCLQSSHASRLIPASLCCPDTEWGEALGDRKSWVLRSPAVESDLGLNSASATSIFDSVVTSL